MTVLMHYESVKTVNKNFRLVRYCPSQKYAWNCDNYIILLLQLNDHIMNECTWIKCPCSSEGKDILYEVGIAI